MAFNPMTLRSLLCSGLANGTQDKHGNRLAGGEKIGQIRAKGPQ